MTTISTMAITQTRRQNQPSTIAAPQASQTGVERSQPLQPPRALARAACSSRRSPAASVSGVGVRSGRSLT
jgi:hypothetical protein